LHNLSGAEHDARARLNAIDHFGSVCVGESQLYLMWNEAIGIIAPYCAGPRTARVGALQVLVFLVLIRRERRGAPW
jgi:hypothetical protein